MSKVFTITAGLENMGAMKTGGQGSVYKGRRVGEIITAIKLLPTPIFKEDGDDKSYADFQNEVHKLKRVNETPHPNVVTILSSGVTDTGNFPFIEMEFIEGPDLEELLKPPHDPVFSIREVLKVAEHLACSLAHCHKLEIRHGDIKSNNVKFNIKTGNYMLLDFGLSVMSDEQRRTSLRRAGAIEFMAPEQNDGEMLFQSDVYGFGIIIFELLAGRVPFPLQSNGESSRNEVRLNHIETTVPDVMELRRQNLPAAWSEEEKDKEMNVPGWLVEMMYRCLEKKPSDRFADGIELYDYILTNRIQAIRRNEPGSVHSNLLFDDSQRLERENIKLKQAVEHLQRELEQQKNEKQQLQFANANLLAEQSNDYYSAGRHRRSVSRGAFIGLVAFTLLLAIVSVYSLFFKSSNVSPASSDSSMVQVTDTFSQPARLPVQKSNSTINKKSEEAVVDADKQSEDGKLTEEEVDKKEKAQKKAAKDSTVEDKDTTDPDPGAQ